MFQNLSKRERLLEYQKECNDIPRSYKYNEIKEELAIQYSEKYEIQYANLFPSAPKLLLFPMNEFGRRKFITTFISPSLLPYDELYDYEGCAKFVTDHITFEPIIEDFRKTPDVISSPTMTLYTRKGDCFDISTVLASLLIGAGYNAFVVCGIAKTDITNNVCINREYDISNLLKFEDQVATSEKKKVERKYSVVEKTPLVSKYCVKIVVEKENEKVGSSSRKKKEEEEEEEEFEGEEEEEEEKEEMDKKVETPKSEIKETEESSCSEKDDRIFSWVLLLPSKRGIEKPLFLNPANGVVTNADDPNFTKVLTIWNHENYWVNMIQDGVNFDLKNKNWECVFLGDENEEEFSFEHVNYHYDFEDEREVLDVPMSFCKPIEISREKYQTRFPNSTKIVNYKNVEVRRSSRFFEKDLSVVNVKVVDEDTRNCFEEHTEFENRKDKLHKRVKFLGKYGNVVKHRELFHPGRKYSSTRMEGLEEIRIENNVFEEYKFYYQARLDGLCSIKKINDLANPNFTKRVIFKFCDRYDFLNYRSVSYREDENSNLPIIVKKTEKFERNYDKEADDDICILEYYTNRTRVLYHFGEDRITRKCLKFSKDGEVSVHLVNHYAKKPSREETFFEYSRLFKLDKRCSDEITRVLEELSEILEIRRNEEISIKFQTSIYDYLHNQPDEKEISSMEDGREKEMLEKERKSRNDILSLYVPDGGIETKDQAVIIFDKIMQRTKDRLNIRTQIIQDRLRAEKSLMNKKRIQIQKQDSENMKKEEQFLKFWEETIFRTKILQERCEKNEKESEEYYLKTQMSLLNDDRLKSFFKDETDVPLKDLRGN